MGGARCSSSATIRSRSSAARCSGRRRYARAPAPRATGRATSRWPRCAPPPSPSADEIAVFAGALRGEVIAEIVPLVEEFVARYADAPPRRGRRGLRRPADLGARPAAQPAGARLLPRALPRVLIDEFQDTDPVQAEIAMLLDRRRRRRRPRARPPLRRRRPEAVDLPLPPRRHRDLRRGQVRPARRPATTLIQQNFRSVEGLLDWVNRVFDDAFGAGERGTQPPHVPLLAVRTAPARTARAGGRRPRGRTGREGRRDPRAGGRAARRRPRPGGSQRAVDRLRSPTRRQHRPATLARLRDPPAGPHRASSSTSTRWPRAASRTAPRARRVLRHAGGRRADRAAARGRRPDRHARASSRRCARARSAAPTTTCSPTASPRAGASTTATPRSRSPSRSSRRSACCATSTDSGAACR